MLTPIKNLTRSFYYYFSIIPLILCFFNFDEKVYGYYLAVSFWIFLVPILDEFMGPKENLSPKEIEEMKNSFFLKIVPVVYILVFISLLYVSAFTLEWSVLNLFDMFMIVFALGLSASNCITASHELIHKNNLFYQLVGKLGLLHTLYLHFEYFHRVGHHANACTKKDESTAWHDENVYQYLMRTIPGCLLKAWRYEVLRSNSTLSLKNKFNLYLIVQASLVFLIIKFFSIKFVIVFFGQAFLGVVLLETVSYIQHYGILKEDKEKIKIEHSWNCNNFISNIFLFNLPRHSDHHVSATKDYFLLMHHKNSLQLPFGYITMISLAFVPFAFKHIMHDKYDRQSKALINMG